MKKLAILALTLFIGNTVSSQTLPVTAGMKLRLDASAGFTGSGTAAAAWTDQSGSGNNMSVLTSLSYGYATSVTSNGFSAIRFAGNCIMQSATTNTISGTQGTIFIAKANNGSGAPVTVTNDATVDNEFVIQDNIVYHHSSSSHWIGRPPQCTNMPADRPMVIAGVFNTNASSADLDNYTNGLVSTVTMQSQGVTASYYSGNRRAYVGGRNWNNSRLSMFYGDIYEVIVYDRLLTSTEVLAVSKYLKCKYSIDYTACNNPEVCGNPSTCSDSCYWKVSGNNILGGNNVFGTLTNDNIKIQTNATNRGIITNSGLLGWNTLNPTGIFHVNTTGLTPTTGIRFEGLPTAVDNEVITVDPVGNLHKRGFSSGGLTNACASINQLPKVTATNGNLGCSQIFDNGTSVGINTTSGFAYQLTPTNSGFVRLDVNGVQRSLTSIVTSDSNAKTNIQPINSPFSIINQLAGKTYYWKPGVIATTGVDDGKQYGFIAQEVQQVMPEAVIVDDDGKYGMNYNSILPVVVEGEKELLQLYNDVKTDNEQLHAQLDALAQQIQELIDCCEKSRTQNKMSNAQTKSNVLYQNKPNPFTKTTEIGYEIISFNANAFITVMDLNGREITRIKISNIGKGSVTIDAGEYQSGMYLYSLVIDGAEVDTKKMVITK